MPCNRAYGWLDTVFYMDGSVEGAVENGGSAIVESVGEVDSPSLLQERQQSGPKYASSFKRVMGLVAVHILTR